MAILSQTAQYAIRAALHLAERHSAGPIRVEDTAHAPDSVSGPAVGARARD